VKIALINLVLVTLTFQPQNHVTSRSFPIPSLNTLGSFVLSYAANKLTDKTEKQKTLNILPTPTNTVVMGNDIEDLPSDDVTSPELTIAGSQERSDMERDDQSNSNHICNQH